MIPLAILVLGLIGFFVLDLGKYLSFESLQANREFLTDYVETNGATAIALYIALYIIVVAFSLPGATIMSITGGFLFGLTTAGFSIMIGATVGATLVFLAAKTAFGDVLREKAGNTIQKMEVGFRENAFNYLLVLRLVPIFPFFIVNLVPAFLGVPLKTYVSATALGIVPGILVYASVGNGLGALFDQGETPDLGIIFEPSVLFPIIGLALLALVPVAYQKFTQQRAQK